MPDVTVHFRDGTKETFKDHGRPGGSYAQRVEYMGEYVVIIDAYDKQTAFPNELVKRVDVDRPFGSGW